MTDLYLVRHGQTQWSKSGRIAGSSDVALADVGRSAVTSLGQTIPAFDLPIQWHISPLKRTRQTCELLQATMLTAAPENQHGNNTSIDARLVELDFGQWEGLLWDDVNREYELEMVAWGEDWVNRAPPSGESFCEQAERCASWLQHIKSSDTFTNRIHVVVAHGGTIRALVCLLLGLELKQAMRFHIDCACVSHFHLPSNADLQIAANWVAVTVNGNSFSYR